MADMYDTSCSSPPPPSLLESDEISLFLHHLLHSSSSSSMFDKAKHMQSFALPPPPPPPMFSTSTAEYCHVKTPPEDLHRPCRSTGLFDLDCRVRDGTSTAESSAAVDSSSALICSSSGVYFPADVKYSSGNTSSYFRTADSDAITAPVERMKFPADNDLDVYDCESEEGLEASEGPSEPIPPRASSKRSRAAEVHNLSEKRRRSRINEKMKALQNLIPNSNKTDKASMLDEAIEYLKQLQLQVQMMTFDKESEKLGICIQCRRFVHIDEMLSMRNGLSLHPMYLPGALQHTQLPPLRMGLGEENGLMHMNTGTSTLPVNQETSVQTVFDLTNQCTPSNQSTVICTMTNIRNSETSSGLESSIQAHLGPF